jgi:UDP-2,3-diacylglucosamine pyrophosphatase LpxH
MNKTKIVVSDMHLGAGHIDEGNVLEDFECDEDFAGLVYDLIAESQANKIEMELILNGDIFEFWQVPALEHPDLFDPLMQYRSQYYLSTTREASRKRMALIVHGHPLVFDALAAFLQADGPRRTMTFIKGNHDVQLHWPDVHQVLREALNAFGERANCLSFEARYISREGIYVEHGNQYAEQMNRLDNFENPIDPKNPDRLTMTPGGRISIHVLSRLERAHPWMDSVKPMTAMIWYLFRFDFLLSVRILTLLLRHVPHLFWLALPMNRGQDQTIREIEELQRELGDGQSLAAACKNPSYCRAFYARVRRSMEPLSVPDFDEAMEEIEDTDDFLVAQGLAETHRQHARLVEVGRYKAGQENACVVLFGHTHEPVVQVLDNEILYINTGSWMWHLDMSKKPAETWRKLIRHGERYAAQWRLTYARIDYDEDGVPLASLRELPQIPVSPLKWQDRLLDWVRDQLHIGQATPP